MEKAAVEINESISIHDFRLTQHNDKTVLVFDILVPYNCELDDENITQALKNRALELDPECSCRITVDTDYA